MNHVRRPVLGVAFVAMALVAAACGSEAATVAGPATTVAQPSASSQPAAVDEQVPAADSSDQTPSTQPPNDDAATASSVPLVTEDPVEVSVENYPSFVATTTDGETFDIASLAGQDVVLWFWAPW